MKFSGVVGFWEGSVETSPDIFEPSIVEKPYTGEVRRNYRRFQSTNNINDDLVTNNKISILSDLYARENWETIRYVIWNGVKWKVTRVEVDYPRLILELGGVYDGRVEIKTE